MSNKEANTIEVLERQFERDVRFFEQDSKMFIGREYSAEAVYKYAKELYESKYINALHPYVYEKYKP